MQAAPGVGIISSAVLISDDEDEIDWEFSGNNFGYATGKVQTNYFGKGVTGTYDRGTLPSVDSPQTLMQTYSLDWSPTTLTWSIDGAVVRTLLAADANNYDHQYPQTPMRLQLGLWNGGDPSNAAGTIQWATGGAPSNLSQAPFTMYVKSVRIETSPCSSYLYTDDSGSYQSIQCIGGAALNSTNGISSAVYAAQTISATTQPSSTSKIRPPPTTRPLNHLQKQPNH
jgi:beta-glucanase (GH16 family)